MKTYVINLARVPERAKYMIEELNRVGLVNAQLFKAIDASELDLQEYSEFYKPASWDEYWELSPTEIACFESHILLWKQCALEDDQPFLISEDDIVISSNARQILSNISEQAADFDIIHLDASGGTHRIGPTQNWGKCRVGPIVEAINSSAFYVVSPAGARKLLERLRHGYCDHVDDFLTRPGRGRRNFQLIPAIAVQGMFAQPDRVNPCIRVSERTANVTINTPPSKGPTLYRLKKEIRRGFLRRIRKYVLDPLLVFRGGLVGPVPLESDLPQYRNSV